MWFGIFAGVWGMAMLTAFVLAVRLSYRIEQRSEGLQNNTGYPRKAMIFHTIFNWRVARDADTQAMRRRMNRLLLGNLAGFALFFAMLRIFGPA